MPSPKILSLTYIPTMTTYFYGCTSISYLSNAYLTLASEDTKAQGHLQSNPVNDEMKLRKKNQLKRVDELMYSCVVLQLAY